MVWLPQVISSVTLITLVLSITYWYLYYQYQENYMGSWAVSWGMILIYMILKMSNHHDYDAFLLPFFEGITIIVSAWFLIKGIYEFLDASMPPAWMIAGATLMLAAVCMQLAKQPFWLVALPVSLYSATCFCWGGVLLFTYESGRLKANQIVGIALFLIGLNHADYSFEHFLPLWLQTMQFYLAEGFHVVAIIGILLIYFQRAREELSASEERFRLLADNAGDIIYLLHLHPVHFEYISPSVTKLIGYTPEFFYKYPEKAAEILFPTDLSFLEQLFNQDGFAVPHYFRIKSNTGKQMWLEQQAVIFYDRQGEPTAIEGIVRDITYRIKMEQNVSRLQRFNLVGQIAAGIGHEIRNPLTGVRGFLQMMYEMDDYQTNPDILKLMVEELDRANSIIEDFLSLSRSRYYSQKWICINRLLVSFLPLLQADATLQDKHIALELKEIPELYLDEKEFRQMVLNLARNGLEAMTAGGILTIATRKEKQEVIMEVRDQGCGINPELLDKLGTPFFTTKEKGTGLGLAVCYSIMHRHRGKITVETNTEGTSFFVRFPLQPYLNELHSSTVY